MCDKRGFEKNEDKKGAARSFILISIFLVICICMITAVYIQGQFLFRHKMDKGTYTYLNEGWIKENDGGYSRNITLPCRLNTLPGETVILFNTLPDDITDGMFMYILVGRNIKVYIDRELRFELNQDDMEIPGKIVKNIYFPIKLKEEDAGKEIRFVKAEEGSRNGNFNQIMYGDLSAMDMHILAAYTPTCILAIMLIFIALVTIICGWFIRIRYKNVFTLRILSTGILLLAVWEICDSQAYQFIFNNYYVDGLVAYMISCIAILPFLKYLNIIQEQRYEKLYVTISMIIAITTPIIYMLHFLNICSFEVTRPFSNALTAIGCLLVLYTIIKDKIKKRTGEYKYVVFGILALAICASIEMIYVNVFHEVSNGLFIMLGLYLLTGAAFIHSTSAISNIETQRQAALQASITKSTFLANMSHEIRTPINSIMGMNEMILRESKEANIKDYAGHIDRASKLLLGVITDILDFSKIEADKLDAKEEEYDVIPLLKDMSNLLEEHAVRKNLQTVITVADTIPARLYGDRIRILQIMVNLISNAAKYTEEGSITFSAYTTDYNEDKCILCFRISDTGIGMKKEDIEHLFESFTRFDQKRNRNIQGTGLGMAIAKRLVDLLNGEIEVESEYGRGTSFVVKFPQRIVSEEVIGSKWRQKPTNSYTDYHEHFKAPAVTILAVDDNNTNLLIIKQYLKKTDMIIDMCNNGKEAIKRCEEREYDLILLDHMMPVMDGIETIEKIRKNKKSHNSKVPIIALTANAIADSKEFYLEKGFDDYISKPIDANEFEKTIMKHLPNNKIIIV